MNPKAQVPLSTHSTMRLGGPAAYLVEVTERSQVGEAVAWAESHSLPFIIIGDGSNIVWSDKGYPGLVIVDKISGYTSFNEDDENVYVTVGSGENWDSVVKRTVADGLTGIEALSLIPGTAGATPVQNVGAYGQEISGTLVSVEAYDVQAKKLVTIASIDCGLGYRTSRFKTADKGRFLITALTLHLRRGNPQPPFYSSLQAYLDQHKLMNPTPSQVRDAVISIRRSKLPDPATVANNGSFFTNPIVDADQLSTLREILPRLSFHDAGQGQYKLSAAELIEAVGFKGFHDAETGMATWLAQSLVLINEHARSTADLLSFKQKIVAAVQGKFDITLVQEPELIGD